MAAIRTIHSVPFHINISFVDSQRRAQLTSGVVKTHDEPSHSAISSSCPVHAPVATAATTYLSPTDGNAGGAVNSQSITEGCHSRFVVPVVPPVPSGISGRGYLAGDWKSS